MSSTAIEAPAVTSYAFEDVVSDQDALRELIGFPGQGAIDKELTTIDPHSKNFIENSPFVLMATSSITGELDASPKGDPAGFVKVLNEKTLLIPDRPGNRRLDGFTNILQNPHIGLIFLIPGVEETLRINGKAMLIKDQALLETMSFRSKTPTIAIAVEAQQVYFHCAKASGAPISGNRKVGPIARWCPRSVKSFSIRPKRTRPSRSLIATSKKPTQRTSIRVCMQTQLSGLES